LGQPFHLGEKKKKYGKVENIKGEGKENETKRKDRRKINEEERELENGTMSKDRWKGEVKVNNTHEVGLKAIRVGGYTKQQNGGRGKYYCKRSGGGGSYGLQQK
jgi:hypothetical protein